MPPDEKKPRGRPPGSKNKKRGRKSRGPRIETEAKATGKIINQIALEPALSKQFLKEADLAGLRKQDYLAKVLIEAHERIYIPPKLDARIVALANRQGRSRDAFIEDMLEAEVFAWEHRTRGQ